MSTQVVMDMGTDMVTAILVFDGHYRVNILSATKAAANCTDPTITVQVMVSGDVLFKSAIQMHTHDVAYNVFAFILRVQRQQIHH